MKLLKLSLYGIVVFLCLACSESTRRQEPDKTPTQPNIIILLADDLGFGDLSSYGSQSIHTPNLDALASEGIRFTQFYAGSAVCTPSRACLMTGKFPLRFNIRQHFRDSSEHMPPSSLMMSELLKDNGYKTAHVGKWHLGGLRPRDYEARKAGKIANPGPLQHGFDHSLTSIEGAPIRPKIMKDRRMYRDGGKYLVRDDERIPEITRHWTDIKIDESIRLIEGFKNQSKPFFLNLWFDAPHTPYEPAPEPHLSKYKKLGVTGDQLLFRSMVSHLDANVGRLIDYLKDEGLFENTIILFSSDNGPAYQGNPGPFKGGKTDLHEGGIRVPMFISWPGQIKANTQSFQTFHMADILPTILEAVGIEAKDLEIDGKSQLEALKGGAEIKRKPLFWQMDLYEQYQNQGPKPAPYATSVILDGQWKLLADPEGPTELFNLNQDHRELYNLLDQDPNRVEKMYAELKKFLLMPRDTTGFVEKGQNYMK
ncbi:MAG: sulfatase-like hydrolase/transferase [Bacteroidota bacterium]